ncbi:MAG: choice-of-anchor Q domain-containing protein, partial [Acidimicrobiales bacterium]
MLTGSLAIDMGDPSIAFNPAEFDQRGSPFVRVFDDPAASGSGIDIGAFELQTVVPSADFNNDNTNRADANRCGICVGCPNRHRSHRITRKLASCHPNVCRSIQSSTCSEAMSR